MPTQRPDLSRVPDDVKTYIIELESRLEQLEGKKKTAADPIPGPETYTEPPTSVQIITLSRNGQIKRTARHLYTRQRRGGMGVFDLDVNPPDEPVSLVSIDEAGRLLIITNLGRAFQLPVQRLPSSEVRSRGEAIQAKVELMPDEAIQVIIPVPTQGYICLVTEHGYVRRLRNHVFGEYMKPGQAVIDVKEYGKPVAGCLSSGDGDLFIATKSGMAIRFAEKNVPPQGCPGIRVKEEDAPVAICGVKEHNGVFLINADGTGTIRLMSGFAANKSPGGGGKLAIKTKDLAHAVTVSETADLFILSRLGKLIRFAAVEVPSKESVVQGVSCMALRGDACVAVTSSNPAG